MGFAFVDTSRDLLEMYEWTGETFVKVGSGTSVSGANNFGLAPLGDLKVAYTDGFPNDELRAHQFDGDAFVQVGSGLPLTNLSTNYIDALNATDIALAGNVLFDKLATYRWNQSSLSFAQVGNALNISSMEVTGLAAVSSSDIAVYDASSQELIRMSFDGTDWAQVGSGYTEPIVSGINGWISLAALSGGDVAAYARWNDLAAQFEVRRYSWDGSVYAQVGSGYVISGGEGSARITAVGSGDIVIAGTTTDTLKRIRWDASSLTFNDVGSPFAFGENIVVPVIAAVPQRFGSVSFDCVSSMDATLLNVNTPYYRVDVENAAGAFQPVHHHTLRATISRQLFSRDRSFSPAKATLSLDNEHKDYSPEVSGNIFGGSPINKQVRVRVTYDSAHYTRFSGTIDRVKINPERGRRKATIYAQDFGKFIKRRRVSIPVLEEQSVESLFAVVASHVGLTSSQIDVESTTDIVNVAWWDDVKGDAILDQLIEFGDYKAFLDTDGVLRVRNRYYQNENTIVASYSTFYSMGYDYDAKDVANRVEVGFTPFRIAGDVGTIAFIDEAIPVVASGWSSLKMTYRDQDDSNKTVAAKSITPPVSSADFQVWTSSAGTSSGTGVNKTAQCSLSFSADGASAVATIFNGTGAKVFVTKLQARGYSVQELPDISFLEVSSDSQVAYGLQDLEIENDLVGRYLHARDYARYLITELPEPVARCDVAIKNKFPDVFVNDLAQRINLAETETGVGSLFVIEGIKESINTSRGLEHEVSYDVRFWRDQGWLILDHVERGLLDSGRLAF